MKILAVGCTLVGFFHEMKTKFKSEKTKTMISRINVQQPFLVQQYPISGIYKELIPTSLTL